MTENTNGQNDGFKPSPYYCTSCGQLIFSRYPGHFSACECGESAVDQNEYYIRVIGNAAPLEAVDDE